MLGTSRQQLRVLNLADACMAPAVLRKERAAWLWRLQIACALLAVFVLGYEVRSFCGESSRLSRRLKRVATAPQAAITQNSIAQKTAPARRVNLKIDSNGNASAAVPAARQVARQVAAPASANREESSPGPVQEFTRCEARNA